MSHQQVQGVRPRPRWESSSILVIPGGPFDLGNRDVNPNDLRLEHQPVFLDVDACFKHLPRLGVQDQRAGACRRPEMPLQPLFAVARLLAWAPVASRTTSLVRTSLEFPRGAPNCGFMPNLKLKSFTPVL